MSTPSDLATLLQYMEDRDEKRHQEDQRLRKEEAATRQQEFTQLIAALSQHGGVTPDPDDDADSSTQQRLPPRPPRTQVKAVISPPPPLQPDATYQTFREWRRRWQDYAVMTDLPTLSLSKRHIQLRTCLTPAVLHTLHYRLQVSQDDTTPIDDVLNTLDKHFKAQTNEALRRRELFSCRQEVGERFNEFFVRVKNLAEAVDVCKGGDKDCEETQIKQVILMGVSDQELIQELIGIIPTNSLDKVVQHCYAYEAAKRTATAITCPSKSASAVSKYKKDKNARQRSQGSSTPSASACDCCRSPHDKGQCPAANTTCNNCGRKGHLPRTQRCPADSATFRNCGKLGHYDQFCRSNKTTGTAPPKGGQPRSNWSAARNSKGSSARRVTATAAATARRPSETSPPVIVSVTHVRGTGDLSMLPDTGADTTVIGPDHLRSIGLTLDDLQPPPQTPTYVADGSPMQPAIGSVQVRLQVKDSSTREWIDVHPGTPVPLLSYRACRELTLIPERFPRPIAQVTHARVQSDHGGQGTAADGHDDTPSGSATAGSDATPTVKFKATHPPASAHPATTPQQLSLPFTTTTTPAEARTYFLKEYADVLVRKEDLQTTPLQPMQGPPMRIHLREDAQPFAIHTARQIPLAYQIAVKQELLSMEAQGIIAPAADDPSPWCHPLVAVPKPHGGVRITTDLSKLNSQVSRPAHPSPTPFAAIRSVKPGTKYFTTVDALHGYWQLKLAEEDQHLTTFITPFGRYKYLRGPMGFAATGDAFCRRGDAALQGISNCVKVVDDVLIYDEELLPHLQRVNTVLARCRGNGITLNADKFLLATPAVQFCGFVLSADGIAADPEKVRAIADFTTPANITDLRSFMGLVNQLAEFSPDISAAAQPLRPLMSPRRAFTWTIDHDTAFQRVKTALASPPVLATFDPQLPTILQTDASRLNGLGYALLQDHGGGQLRLIQCGSRFLTDAETRYATIELEMLATVWAMHKCGYYLKGLPTFDHVTEHRPLIPIINNYTLDAVENPRLQRLKEKLSPFIFTARWRAGKQLCIPDALSRHPVSHPTDDDDVLADTSVQAAVAVRVVRTLAEADAPPTTTDTQLEDLQQAARTDQTYVKLLECVRHGFPSHRYDLHNSLLDYWKIRDELYCDGDLVLYGPRVVVPAALRKSVLRRLHDSHRGAEATKRRAKQTVFWPGINADITNVVRACDACQTLLPSQQQEEYRNDDHPTRPFESISADFFSVAGKSFLVIVDRLSGWPVVFSCGKDTTAAATIKQFNRYFSEKGAPVRLRTDGGPQFTSKEFQDFLQRWNVRHVITSPHHPQSNGHAEAAVKSVKHLIMKVAPTGDIHEEHFHRGLLEVRNTPDHTGRSPAQILYGHPLRTCVPAHPVSFQPQWQPDAEDCDRRAAKRDQDTRSRYNTRARQLPVLQINQRVRVQDPVTKRWYQTGTVVAQPRPRQYDVRLPNGRTLRRNRVHLRPVPAIAWDQAATPAADGTAAQDPITLRRSDRLRLRQGTSER